MIDTVGLHRSAQEMIERERVAFAKAHPVSKARSETARRHFPGGVPLHWMLDWSTPFPPSVVTAIGARIQDADGLSYVDFCLGDSGALFGHSPPAVAEAIAAQVGRGLTAMLPGTEVAAVGESLARIFRLPFWQMTATASDANRAVIRWSRALTGRGKVLVFDGCYHGQVDEAFVELRDGATVRKPGLIGQPPHLSPAAVAVPFNDLAAVETALRAGDIALVLAEPALTNTAMVLPEAGFLEGLIALAHRYGALVCFDETHTIATAFGGHTGSEGLATDFFVCGKPIAGGLPAGVFGFTAEIEARMGSVLAAKEEGYSGIGTTLSGNLLTLAAMRACLDAVMTEPAYDRMISGCEWLAGAIMREINARDLPWCMVRLGARAELIFRPLPPQNGAEARTALDPVLSRALHLFLINRGLLLTPFHNMMLVSPATDQPDLARLAAAFGAAFDALLEGAAR